MENQHGQNLGDLITFGLFLSVVSTRDFVFGLHVNYFLF